MRLILTLFYKTNVVDSTLLYGCIVKKVICFIKDKRLEDSLREMSFQNNITTEKQWLNYFGGGRGIRTLDTLWG